MRRDRSSLQRTSCSTRKPDWSINRVEFKQGRSQKTKKKEAIAKSCLRSPRLTKPRTPWGRPRRETMEWETTISWTYSIQLDRAREVVARVEQWSWIQTMSAEVEAMVLIWTSQCHLEQRQIRPRRCKCTRLQSHNIIQSIFRTNLRTTYTKRRVKTVNHWMRTIDTQMLLTPMKVLSQVSILVRELNLQSSDRERIREIKRMVAAIKTGKCSTRVLSSHRSTSLRLCMTVSRTPR